MKKILTIASAVIVVILAIPAVVGQYIKYQIPGQLENQVWPDGYRAHVTQYSSGWLSGTADVVITRGPYLPQSTSQIRYPLKLTFYNGPVVLTSDLAGKSKLFLNLAVMKGTLAVQDLSLNFMGKIGFSGNASMNFAHQNYRYSENGVTATIGSIDSHTSVTSAWSVMNGQANINNLQVAEKEMALSIPSINVTYDLNKVSKALWLGTRQISIPSIVFTTGGKPQVTVNQITMSGNASLQNKMVSGEGKLQIQQINYLNQENVGPIALTYNASNYAADKVEQFSEAVAAMQWDEKDPAQAQQNMQTIIRQAIGLLPGTKHQLQLAATTKQGNLNINGDLNFPAQMQAIPQTSFEADFANIMTNAVANLKLSIAIPLVNEIMKQLGSEQTQAQAMLNSLQNAGAVKIENNLLISEMHYQSGLVTINGIPIQQITAKLNAPSAASTPAEPQPSSAQPAAAPAEHEQKTQSKPEASEKAAPAEKTEPTEHSEEDTHTADDEQ